ncbi:DUF6368 family protein [Streptomyces antibioticus]|uniref:DUF6368 family protein n=1 Tax=Streptomyces antibioticus TaxID=1890 RepID=UPI003696C743
MSGPTLVIELAEPPSPGALREFRALLVGLSSHFEERRPGSYDVNVPAERLGVEDRRTRTGTSRSRACSAATPPRTRTSRPSWVSIRSARTGVGPSWSI